MLDEFSFEYSGLKPELVKDAYSTYGVVLIKDLVSEQQLASLRGKILQLIQARAENVNLALDATSSLDQAFNTLCAQQRSLGGDVFDCVKDLSEFYEIILSEPVRQIAELLVPGTTLQIPFDICLFRIDRPQEDRFGFDWHQDYTYNLLSSSAITGWIPLTDVTTEMGAMKVIPGSHKELESVSINNPDFVAGGGGGGHIFSITSKTVDELEKLAVDLPVTAGSAAFFHSYLLHRSGKNQSDKNRWVVNPRFGDFLDTDIVKRGWVRGIGKRGVQFGEIHPDYVTAN